MSETLFSRIIRREIPAQIVFEDDDLLGFKDIHPQAPMHVLFIPKQPIPTLNAAGPEHALVLGRLLLAAAAYAKAEGFAEDGYRVVMNCNEHGGQSVFHVHLHLLGGRQMSWPPG